MSSLNVHAGCRGPLAMDEDPSGDFWDTGIAAVAFNGGDRWSVQGTLARYTRADLGRGNKVFVPSALLQLLESSSR